MLSKRTIKKVSIIIGIILIVLWFGGNLGMYLYCKYFLSPRSGVNLNSVPEKLKVKEADIDAETLYLMGFKLKFPFYKDDIKSVYPSFLGHEFWNVAIFLKNKTMIVFSEHFEITEEIKKELADRVKDVEEIKESLTDKIFNIFEKTLPSDCTLFECIRAAEYARLKDFSWWNLLHNMRLTVLLTLKSLPPPEFKRKSYDLETPHLKGILRNIEMSNKAKVTVIDWDWDNKSYSFEIVAASDGKISTKAENIISTIQKESDIEKSYKAMESLYKNKEKTKYPKELVLLSIISLKGATPETLKELLNTMKNKDYQLDNYIIEGIKREIEYIEGK